MKKLVVIIITLISAASLANTDSFKADADTLDGKMFCRGTHDVNNDLKVMRAHCVSFNDGQLEDNAASTYRSSNFFCPLTGKVENWSSLASTLDHAIGSCQLQAG